MNKFLESVDRALFEQGRRRPWLAAEAQIPISTINNWFSYDRWPAVDQAAMVADALGTTIDELMGRQPQAALPKGPRAELLRLSYDIPDYLVDSAVSLVSALVMALRTERHMADTIQTLRDGGRDPNVGDVTKK